MSIKVNRKFFFAITLKLTLHVFFYKFVQMKSEGEVRSFPPAHQLQLNNRRKSVVTAATTTDTQTAVSPTLLLGYRNIYRALNRNDALSDMMSSILMFSFTHCSLSFLMLPPFCLAASISWCWS